MRYSGIKINCVILAIYALVIRDVRPTESSGSGKWRFHLTSHYWGEKLTFWFKVYPKCWFLPEGEDQPVRHISLNYQQDNTQYHWFYMQVYGIYKEDENCSRRPSKYLSHSVLLHFGVPVGASALHCNWLLANILFTLQKFRNLLYTFYIYILPVTCLRIQSNFRI